MRVSLVGPWANNPLPLATSTPMTICHASTSTNFVSEGLRLGVIVMFVWRERWRTCRADAVAGVRRAGEGGVEIQILVQGCRCF